MKLAERPEPPAAINDVIVQMHASGFVPTEMAWAARRHDRHLKVRPMMALNDEVEKRKSRVVWYPVERHVNVHPMMMASSAEELASQGL
jgi:hypothetical protein